jgi:peroxiredoxin Q/BCP
MAIRRLIGFRAWTALSVFQICAVAAQNAHSADQPTPPAVGTPAPAFHLQDQAGAWHTLSEYRGRWLVLYFYPKDDTPGCTTQACGFRDNIFAFNKLGAVILGISVDDVASHKQFAEEHSLPFTLLADSTKETAKSYGVLRSALGFMEIAARETFIIDPQGRVAKHYPAVDPKGHSQAVMADLKALQARQGS